jgi:hypothetical protein
MAKKMANHFFKKAEDNAEDNKPWSLRNMRTYQRFACEALKERSEVLTKYLKSRTNRIHS